MGAFFESGLRSFYPCHPLYPPFQIFLTDKSRTGPKVMFKRYIDMWNALLIEINVKKETFVIPDISQPRAGLYMKLLVWEL